MTTTPDTAFHAVLEEISRQGETMAPRYQDTFAVVRGRIRRRRAVKAVCTGALSVAALALVIAGALYQPPESMGHYMPAMSGFTVAPMGAHSESIVEETLP